MVRGIAEAEVGLYILANNKKADNCVAITREVCMQTFGMRLEALRIARSLKSKQLAERAGLDPSYIAQIERGRRDPPRQQVIERLSAALDLNHEEAERLAYSAVNEKLMRAIASSEVRSPAMDLLETMLKHEEEFDLAGFLAVKTFAKAYLLSRSEWTEMGKTRPAVGRLARLTTEVAM